jgi:hypothetical protein
VDLFERLAAARPTSVETAGEKPRKDPAQTLLNFLQRWNKPTICMREILNLGPYSLRDRESAIDAAEVLVKNNWLTPAKKHRHDMHKWQIVRKPIVPPTLAT